ncbi:hypothetical protein AJ80_03780 [Polytolypa hystricis UAMH7299]|uniref:Extracelular serine carboxypeptidase n=1 Tax=Polytolypa hystricis (strain UAMH7299) TaxID=1447883 RepID=A0A2B7YFQ0_POLH7|nr:hypothetical protein AJ80_03780 [Polytolypa hystricis UAMH7299]
MAFAELKSTILLLVALFISTSYAFPPTSTTQLRPQWLDRSPGQDAIDHRQNFPNRTISVPVDHFRNSSRYEPHTDETFELRYWFDASHYVKGGPVIILAAGEADAIERLPYMEKGILGQLARATNGIGVVLEHRYYGESFPMKDLSTESLRFLSTEQAMADTAYFAKNVVFEGLDHLDLTSRGAPYILYGGSYSGAQVAFLRVEYPDLFWGAIASSAVTKAIYDYWEYLEPIRVSGPAECIKTTQKVTHIMDNILMDKKDLKAAKSLKSLFGLADLKYDDDFANTLASAGLLKWQYTNWDPEINDPMFSLYCANITSPELLYPTNEDTKKAVKAVIRAGGYGNESHILTTRLTNFAGFVNVTRVIPCKNRGNTLEKCFGSHDPESYRQDDLTETWRSWPYQFCTEWGFFITGSGAPKDQLPLISRLINPDFNTIVCREAFNITTPPNVERVNKYGGFDIEYPRLAFVDGEADPWRMASPHAWSAKKRRSTLDKPFILIEDAVHHWDENGLFPNETTPYLPPRSIIEVQRQEIEFTKKWLQDWKVQHKA